MIRLYLHLTLLFWEVDKVLVALGRILHPTLHAVPRTLAVELAPHERSQSGNQLIEIERLRQIIVRTELEALDAFGHLVSR